MACSQSIPWLLRVVRAPRAPFCRATAPERLDRARPLQLARLLLRKGRAQKTSPFAAPSRCRFRLQRLRIHERTSSSGKGVSALRPKADEATSTCDGAGPKSGQPGAKSENENGAAERTASHVLGSKCSGILVRAGRPTGDCFRVRCNRDAKR